MKKSEVLRFILKYMKPRRKLFMVAFMLLAILSLVSLLPPYFTKLAFDEGIMKRNIILLTEYVLILAGLYILKSFLNYLSTTFFTLANQNSLFDIKKDLTNRILKLPVEFFSNNESGYIVSRFKEIDALGPLFSLQTFSIDSECFRICGSYDHHVLHEREANVDADFNNTGIPSGHKNCWNNLHQTHQGNHGKRCHLSWKISTIHKRC